MTIENEVRGGGKLAAATRLILLVTLAVAAIWTVIATVTGAAGLVAEVAHSKVEASIVARAPVPPSHSDASFTSGFYDSASVVVADAPVGLRVLAATSESAMIVTRLALGVAFVLLIVEVSRRAPFSSHAPLQVTMLGGIAMTGAVVGVGLGVLVDWMVADLVSSSDRSGHWPMAAAFDIGPVAVGFGLMIVGQLVSHGTQLQRATDGLV